MVNDFYWFWLCNISGIGPMKIKAILNHLEDAEAVYHASEQVLQNIEGLNISDVERIKDSRKDIYIHHAFEEMQNSDIRFIHMGSSDYPKKLKLLCDSPAGLYVRGKLPKEDTLSVAIVGARNCTEYGRKVAAMLGEHFARMGIQVISGMAAGIDAAGQRGCLLGDGYTCAVLGCGVDICYPRENIQLFTELLAKGCVISEFPIGAKPLSAHFPVRNRIISGLSDVVIVVEARKKSGSLITADLALEQNKEIMAVPGRISDALSEGCNELIKQGAAMLTSPQDIRQLSVVARWLEEGNHTHTALNWQSKNEQGRINPLASKKNMLYSLLDLNPVSLEKLIQQSGMDIQSVTENLLEMQLNGLVKEIGKNRYIKTKL